MQEEISTETSSTPNRWQRMVETILRVFGIDDFISYAHVMHNFFFVLAIVLIGIIEIFNTHLAVRLNRNINKKQKNIQELRWEYISVKTEMNLKSKQSELQKILEPHGIKALQEPPKKIEVPKDILEK